MSKRFSLVIQWGIIGIWLCLVSVLVYRTYFTAEKFSTLQSLSEKQFKTSEEWLGIYVKNVRIGYIKTVAEKIGDEYRFTQTGETGIPQQGKTIQTSTKFTCLTDLNYRIKSFEFETRSGDTYYKSRGDLDKDNMLLVFMEKDEKKKTETRKIEGQAYLPITVKYMLVSAGLEKGKQYTVPVLNIFAMEVKDTIIEVKELIPVKAGINVNTAYVLKIGDNFQWVTDRGYTLKQLDSSGLSYMTETEDPAKSRDKKYIFDFLTLPVLKSNKLLSKPEELSKLKIRISGIDMSQYPLLNEGRQVLRDGLLEISRENVETLKEKSYDLPYQDSDLKSYISPTKFVQSDHHTIIYNAKKMTAIEKNAFRLARYLTSNLYLTIRKIPMMHLVTSMDIFKTRAGESNEHTVMFTSFARAAGLPTRMVSGLVYLKGHFYFHTWPEVWIGEWAAADPTMGQFPADVTHIRFAEGDIDEIASFGNMIGKIKIDIMEAL